MFLGYIYIYILVIYKVHLVALKHDFDYAFNLVHIIHLKLPEHKTHQTHIMWWHIDFIYFLFFDNITIGTLCKDI